MTRANIRQILKFGKLRNLTIERKIIIFLIFKMSALPKIIFQMSISPIPYHIITKLENMEKKFLWGNSIPKIKYDNLCNDYKD